MRRTLLSILAASTLAAAIPAVASAQAWQTISQREARFIQRIDAGVRSGELTPREGNQLRSELNGLMRLEDQYRWDGRFTQWERNDLDRRFEQLGRRIQANRNDWEQDRRWDNLDARQAQFEQRMTRAVRDGRLTRYQADMLRREFRDLARLEQQYRRDGFTSRERADLNWRFDRLEQRFRAEIDRGYGYGYGNGNGYGYGYGNGYGANYGYGSLLDFLFGIMR